MNPTSSAQEDLKYERRLDKIFSYLPPEALRESRQILSKKEQLRQIIQLVQEVSIESRKFDSVESFDDYCGRILKQVYEENLGCN
jgi:hypothetical protein